ncbi:MAG TPA: ATP-binding protein [Ramlibacter sp.]|jgi:signal transduction histidine kinase
MTAVPQSASINTRILLVDDTASIHADFRKCLAPKPDCSGLDAQEQRMFGDSRAGRVGFELDCASQGREGLAMVEAALLARRPYAMAFIDMRMPPGWDGLETIEHLWRVDPDLQVVICTAYSDHPWEEMVERLPVRDRLLVLKKPFDVIEVRQLAHTLTTKWSLARQAADQMDELERTVQRLRATEEQLRHAGRELESFAHSVARDLHAPLGIAGSFCGLLAGELAECGDRGRHYLERVRANVHKGEALLGGLVALTEIAQVELHQQKVDVSRAVLQVITELRAADPDREVIVAVEPGMHVRADARLMHKVLSHLVENAWKFTSRRTVARIEVGWAPAAGEQPVVFVRDNGCGFDMTQAGGLFQNLHRLHGRDQYPGTGLGLVTANRVLARHGGRIWAESRPDEGSTFYFSLPGQPAGVAPRGGERLEYEA